MLYGDIAVAVVVALFMWLVPIRRNGIPGLRGRGTVPTAHQPLTDPGRATPRPVPPAEVIGDTTQRSAQAGREARILAELDSTWEPGYADWVASRHHSGRDSA